MGYMTNDQWNDMSDEARQAYIELAANRAEQGQDPITCVSIEVSKIHISRAEPDEQFGFLEFLFRLFGK